MPVAAKAKKSKKVKSPEVLDPLHAKGGPKPLQGKCVVIYSAAWANPKLTMKELTALLNSQGNALTESSVGTWASDFRRVVKFLAENKLLAVPCPF